MSNIQSLKVNNLFVPCPNVCFSFISIFGESSTYFPIASLKSLKTHTNSHKTLLTTLAFYSATKTTLQKHMRENLSSIYQFKRDRLPEKKFLQDDHKLYGWTSFKEVKWLVFVHFTLSHGTDFTFFVTADLFQWSSDVVSFWTIWNRNRWRNSSFRWTDGLSSLFQRWHLMLNEFWCCLWVQLWSAGRIWPFNVYGYIYIHQSSSYCFYRHHHQI